MAVNIEIKARARDFKTQRRIAEALSDKPCQVIPQVDTFFITKQGRFKLRELSPDFGQLVFYQRPESAGPKRSEYYLYETKHPSTLKALLSMALGVRGVVRKTRYLYLIGQTRIHLDDVEGLGCFLELEVVLSPSQSDIEGQAIAHHLMESLGVEESDLIEGAYLDLLSAG